MQVEVYENRVIVSGNGPRYLYLKSRLSDALSEGDICHLGKGRLSIPYSQFHCVATIFDDLNVNYPADLQHSVKNERNSLSEHLNAKQEISSFLENQICTTENPFWDDILDPKQSLGVRCMITPGIYGMCLFDEQGAGKTVMSIAAFDILFQREDIEALLVICPKSMMGEWPKEISRFLDNKYTVSVLEGDRENKTEIIQRKTDVLVSNFEGISNHLELLKAIASSRATALVIDESFYVKNPQAKRSTTLLDLRTHCQIAYCLCGTPAPNRPEDIIHQFNVADGGFTFENFRVPEDKQRAIEQITTIIDERGIFIRRQKSELLPNLPEKSFQLHSIQLTGKQALLYRKAKEELVLYLRSLDNSSFKKELGTYFQKRSALLQICVDPAVIDPGYNEVPAKFLELDRLVNSIVKINGEKVVLWSFYKNCLDKLEGRFKSLGVVRIDGSVISTSERGRAVDEFQKNPEIKMFIGNPAAAGAGITLHAASNAIYVSYSNQAAHYLQSLDRIHRRGQEADEVKYHLLVAKDTIEEKEIARLREKEKCQQELLGDHVDWPSSVDDALNELGISN